MDYYKSVVFEDRVYVFWLKESKGKEELFVECFDDRLKRTNNLRKIYELTSNKDRKSRYLQSALVLANKNAGEKIIIGGEMTANVNEPVRFEYKVLNKDLSFSNANQISLPIKLLAKSYGLTSTYEYGTDGNLYIRSFARMDKEERKSAKKGEVTAYSILSMVNLNSGDLTPFTMKFENKNIFDFGYKIEKTGVKVYAFFCDLQKDPSGDDMHGIFYCQLDNRSFTMKSQNFTYFDKATLDKLFAKDLEDKKKSKGLFKSKKNQKSDEESIDSRFEIESVQSIDDSNIVIFCTKMYNYAIRTCTTNSTGGRTCTTQYYCQKSNVTAFKVGPEGNLLWASNVDRAITYDGWNIYDLRVINKGTKYYAIYGSSFQTTAKKKNFFSRKSRKQMQDKFEYAVFDDANGAYKKHEYVVNAVNAKDKKYVDPVNISVMDNKFYVDSEKIRIKPAFCLTGICPPVYYILMMNGIAYRGTGNLGVISPLK